MAGLFLSSLLLISSALALPTSPKESTHLLGYTSSQKILMSGELKMMEKRHHHDTVLIQPVPLMSHDPIYGTWMGQEWRSAYYDPSHSRHWNFKHGFTNYDGVRYVTVPVKAKRENIPDSSLVAHSKRDLPVAVPAAPAPPKASQKEHKKKKGKKKPKKGGKHNDFMKREETVDPGTAGFVEIASPFFANPQIQTGVSGLTTSTDPEDPSRILLATSNTHSTQFWLSKVDGNMTNPNESIAQLRLPVLSSTTMQSKMECATFGVEPPTKLILTPCGESNSSYSQNFLYNSNTGELKPYYDVAVIAVPNNSTSNTTVVKNFLSTSSGNSSNSTNSSNTTTVTGTVSLYWIPASAFFADSASSSSTSPTSTAADSSETPVNAFVATPTTVEESKITEMPSSSAMDSSSVVSSTDSASAMDSSSIVSTSTISTVDSPTSTSSEIPTMTSSSMASALPSAAAFVDGGDNSSTGSDDGSDSGNVEESPVSANQLYKPTSTDDLDPTNVKVGDSAEQSQDYQSAQEDTEEDVSEDMAESSVP